MGERIGDGPLEERLGGSMERSVRGKVIVKCFQRSEEAGLFFRPGERRGIVPAFPSLDRAESPIEQITHVGEDLNGLTAAAIEGGEPVRGTIEGAGSAVGKAGDSMAENGTFFVHRGQYTAAERRQDGD